MSNLFQEVFTNSRGAENKLLEPTYPYYKNIKTPTETTKDIDGLIQYIELLLSGNSEARQPLGNKGFLNKGVKCDGIGSCKDPSKDSEGNVPFISSVINAFLYGSTPTSQQITIKTITNDNTKSSELHYVTLADIHPCRFLNGKNPVTGKKCVEAFQNKIQPEVLIPDDPLAQLYFASLGVVGLFILYRLMEKSK
jgi:hypothetical protein